MTYRGQRYYQWLRLRGIRALGGKCFHCGTTDVRVLQFDHINGDGGRKGWKTAEFRKRVLKGQLDVYQLLCANCHVLKTQDNKEFAGRKLKKERRGTLI